MVVTALFRKRTYCGAATAFFGLAIFNLHYWGFGLPFIAGGAWLLSHSWRINQRLKLARRRGPATGVGPGRGDRGRRWPAVAQQAVYPPTAPKRTRDPSRATTTSRDEQKAG